LWRAGFSVSNHEIRAKVPISPSEDELSHVWAQEILTMALTRFGFIVTGDQFVQEQGTEKFSMRVVGVSHPEQGIAVAQKMVADGVQLIELCGGFSPVWAGKIIEAIEYQVPVGVVAYGPESIEKMHRLFST
jgi:hypothetical protein